MSDSLWPHESQHTRPPCPSPTPGVHSNSRPSSQWYHPAISSSVVPFSSCPQPLPASECFPMSQLFTWGGLSTGVSALAGYIFPWLEIHISVHFQSILPSQHSLWYLGTWHRISYPSMSPLLKSVASQSTVTTEVCWKSKASSFCLFINNYKIA